MSDEKPELPVDLQFATATLGVPYMEDRGFNEHGVRENEDGSVDVIYRAMEPGIRNGFEVTEDFLSGLAGKGTNRQPAQMDHSKSQRDNVGFLESKEGEESIWFRDGALGLMLHIPNTGNSFRSDIIKDFTHEPPAVTDGSISFRGDSVEVELPEGYDNLDQWRLDHMFGMAEGHPTFIDAEISEFSLTPFPGGYDRQSGGVAAAFREEQRRAKTGGSLLKRSSLLRDR